MKRIEDSLRDIWDNIKLTNIQIIGIPEGEERETGAENIMKNTIAENFLNLGKETVIQVHEVQRVSNKINPKRSTPRHFTNKMAKFKAKERI